MENLNFTVNIAPYENVSFVNNFVTHKRKFKKFRICKKHMAIA